MKHIIKFNEDIENDEVCDFETFKELMLDVSDYYKCVFANYEEHTYTPCYVCAILFKTLDFERTRNIIVDSGIYDETAVDINEIASRIKDIEKRNAILIEYNKKILSMLEIVKNDITPRFKSFSNYDSCNIGYNNSYDTDDEDSIEIYFYLKKK